MVGSGGSKGPRLEVRKGILTSSSVNGTNGQVGGLPDCEDE
jgi:hypothetical protein